MGHCSARFVQTTDRCRSGHAVVSLDGSTPKAIEMSGWERRCPTCWPISGTFDMPLDDALSDGPGFDSAAATGRHIRCNETQHHRSSGGSQPGRQVGRKAFPGHERPSLYAGNGRGSFILPRNIRFHLHIRTSSSFSRFSEMDFGPTTREAFYRALRGDHSLTISGANFGERNNQCPFIEKGSMSFRWMERQARVLRSCMITKHTFTNMSVH